MCRLPFRGVLSAALTFLVPSLALAQPAPLPQAERQQLDRDLRQLEKSIADLRDSKKLTPDNYADAEIFAKAVDWALRYDANFTPADITLLKKGLDRGKQRLALLTKDKRPWASKPGRVARAFVSTVDGSVQPYGVILPKNFDAAKPIRLDVVLHGSSRPVGMSELRFLNRFDDGDEGGLPGPDQGFIELHPLGRVENCYRWAGETDVFEAIDAACRNYKIDRDRVVLRGMSMGASGTWHLGLKHPDRFVALGPYCGYVDTHQFSLTPLPTFPKVGPLPWHQEKTLRMLDSVDYAANAGVVPVVAAMGEKDVFFQAHVIMSRAMEKEGLRLVNLISPGTGHVVDPVTHKEQMRRIGAYAAKGLDREPQRVRFVTWTLKYSKCHWLQVRGLREHYARAELEGLIDEDGNIDMQEPDNVSRFAILAGQLRKPVSQVRFAGFTIPIPAPFRRRTIELAWHDGAWRHEPTGQTGPTKQPGLQGPIDDAFTTPFLCVRGTGQAWNPSVQKWADASLRRFAAEWRQYFRGELPIKDDKDVTNADVAEKNLILFGDPGSNAWIAKVRPDLGISWTKDELRVGEQTYPAGQYAPLIIRPNPLPEGRGRYVVINSGHTFRGKDLGTINYLLFPRLGDWAVMFVGGKPTKDAAEGPAEEVIRAGFFDEQWRLPSE